MSDSNPNAHCQEVTPETFAELRARYCGYIDSQDVQNLVYVETWIQDMVSCGTTENECYRMFGEAFDDDLLGGAKLLAEEWMSRNTLVSQIKARYMLRFCQRVLFANYAIFHAIRMETLRWRAGDGLKNLLWRVFAAYSLPRLWASILIGMAAVTGSGAMQTGLQRLGAQGNHFWLWLSLMLLAAILFGMLDVERRAGRRWKDVICRSLGLLVVGAGYSCLIGVGWTFVLAKYLQPVWPYDPRYACLSAATALGLAHIVQLFWHEASTAEPM
jgi:hypothetical protein